MVDIPGLDVGSIGTWGSGLGTVLLVIIGVVIAGLLFWLIYNISKYKFRFVVRELVSGRKRIKNDKARLWKDKRGVEYWKLLKSKALVPVPPVDAIDIDTRGKYFVEAYKTPGGEYHYIVDNANIDFNDISLEPVTTNQRAMLADQIKLANDRRKKSIWEHLQPIAGGLMVVAVFIILIAFYGKIAEPFLTSQELQNANQAQLNEGLKLNNEALMRINQILDGKQEIKDINDGELPS
ncbi:MAG: hypothetical protein ACTSYG_07575 [Candidatus Heimdallarchaeota archaeon]